MPFTSIDLSNFIEIILTFWHCSVLWALRSEFFTVDSGLSPGSNAEPFFGR
jgi:hypothetical protein